MLLGPQRPILCLGIIGLRGVFQSIDGADGYLCFHIKVRLLSDHNILQLLTLILGPFLSLTVMTLAAQLQLSTIHHTSLIGSPYTEFIR